ncbi:MAG: SDR family oxidoreductase [Xanthomonadales bacterium]|nr:SDR family oxidoreductase [Xanthomonadales bacterium]
MTISNLEHLRNQTAVITGAGSGFGLEFARMGARLGMKLVLADIQADALEAARAEFAAAGVEVLAQVVDVSDGDQIQALADATMERFGAPHLLFNNAGVGASGLIWESSIADWNWNLGVNLWGVIHGVRLFTPLMLAAAEADPEYRGHIVNVASMAGLVNAPGMGVYNVAKHAVVSLSETLYHDLSLVTQQLHCSVLCPYFVPTGIARSERNRPADLANAGPMTRSQRVTGAMVVKAVESGRLTAADIAELTFQGIADNRFYLVSHPKALSQVKDGADALVSLRNPPDPYADRPELRTQLETALRG